MRLFNTRTHTFRQFHTYLPPYVVASHRWKEGTETSYQDVQKQRNTHKDGYTKFQDFTEYVRTHLPHVEWIWMDTCCINQKDVAELSEAVNLMFEWYRNAELCIAYLVDVESVEDKSAFEKSEWFKRGWTLQELLAPRMVVFVTRDWQVIGRKGDLDHNKLETSTEPRLEKDLARITGIPEQVLHDFSTSSSLSVDERLKWMEGRSTTRVEDMSYALYGIFDVAPGANYGEKHERARQRLLAAITYQDNLAAQRAERFHKIVDWLSPADPWTNHSSARSLHEPQTGAWLVKCHQYQRWKSAAARHLWIHGKAGCGKTILCSTAIEDVKEHCQRRPNAGYAAFYFSFSDDRKQRLADLLRSLVAQLGWKGPALSMLQQAYDKPNRSLLGPKELETILLLCFEAYDEVFVLIDALDECPEGDDERHSILEGLAGLSQAASRVKILATSRELPDIRTSMAVLGSEAMPLVTSFVDADIKQYVANGLARDHRLSRLDGKTKTLIEETISAKADGMFRWAYCQVRELKKLKSTRPKFVEEALFSLPPSLDETYERMLAGIPSNLRIDALKLLRWLAYAESPPSLSELVDVAVIDLTAQGNVEIDDRPGLDDTLEILSGLVIAVGADRKSDESYEEENAESEGWEGEDDKIELAIRPQQIDGDTKVRLAHFSVKEYLESRRILESSAKDFHLESAREHRILLQSCLVYLMHYSSNEEKLSTRQDLETFPLLQYAAKSWFHHCALQENVTITPVVTFLCTETTLRDWLRVCQPDRTEQSSFRELKDVGSSLYYASFLGLELVVENLLKGTAHANAHGGQYGNALQAASVRGHEKVMQMLIDVGADVNAVGGEHSYALQAAAASGHEKIARLLLEAGSNVNATGLDHRSALHAAAIKGQAAIVHLLLEHGAKMTADYNNMTPLHYAVQQGSEDIIKIMLSFGTPVDLTTKRQIWLWTFAETGRCWSPESDPDRPIPESNTRRGLTPLHYAALVGSLTMIQFLLDQGADPNALSEYGETALHLALKGDLHGPDWRSGNEDHWNDPAFKIEYSLDLMDPPYDYENDEYFMVQAEIDHVRSEIVEILCSHYATRVLIHDHYGATPLHCVPFGSRRSETALAALLSRGLKADLCDGSRRTAMHLACSKHDLGAVNCLISYGAKVEAVDHNEMNALHYAAESGDVSTIRLILQIASRNQQTNLAKARDSGGRNALHILLECSGYVDIAAVRLLVTSGVELNDLTNDKYSPLALYLSRFLDRSSHKAEVAGYLLGSGADPLFRHSTDGQNLGHLAAQADEICIILLETLARHGVDLRAEDYNGRNILHHCAIAGSLTDNNALGFLCDTVKLSLATIDRSGKTPMALVLEKKRNVNDRKMFRPDRWHHVLHLLEENTAST